MKTEKPLAWLGCFTFLLVLNAAAEQTAIVRDGRINVRGRPSLVGEVITQLQKGEQVVVLEEVPGATSNTNEPPRWLKIQMPAHTPVWVFAPFIDSASKTVTASRLNLRAGPGENYSVVGRLDRGARVSEIRRVEDWMEIETPPGAYAFVAAHLLTPPGSAPVPPPGAGRSAAASPSLQDQLQAERTPKPMPLPDRTEPAAPAPPPQTAATIPAPVPRPEPPAARPVESTSPPPPATAPPSQASQEPAPRTPPGRLLPPIPDAPRSVTPATLPVADSPPYARSSAGAPREQTDADSTRRVVRREGLVRSTVSIQAPTYYELLNPDSRKTINYLHADKLDINLKDYRGRRVIVTGEEAIDPRWPKTPLIEVEKLELIP